MNKTEQLISTLKIAPLTRREISTALGYKFSDSQINRLLKSGVLTEFTELNSDSSARYARLYVTKLRVSGTYVDMSKRSGYTRQKTLERYAVILRNNGYTVTKGVP